MIRCDSRRFLAAAWLSLAAVWILGAGATAAAPPRVEAGGRTLLLAGEAVREKLFVDIYRVALYLPDRGDGMRRIADTSVPKALQFEVLYDGGAPDKIPAAWAEEILPQLPPAKDGELRRIATSLARGDRLRISFVPDDGTVLTRNGEVVLRDPGHALMAGFVDIVLGPDPVSEGVRNDLLGRAGKAGWSF